MKTLGMFARLPVPGKTKTRLAAAVGDVAAARIYAAFVEDLLHRQGQRPESFLVAATPDDTATRNWFQQRLSSEARLEFQPNGGLGDRIAWFFSSTIRFDGDRAVLIGSDSPDIPAAIIDDAFQQLRVTDMVVSPAGDGGFVLVGLSRPPQHLFDNVAWSSPSTLLNTLAAAREQDFSVTLLQPWYDIDTVENLGTLLALQQSDSSCGDDCPATRAVLLELWPEIEASF
ncbi:MAG: TIGR04282 family arsenosugar biosynthesis glycosyltransferase [Fuerstiella sp.]